MLNLLYQTGYPYLHMLHYKPNILRLTLLPVTDLPASETSTKMTFMSGGTNFIDSFIKINSICSKRTNKNPHTRTYKQRT